jgi:hypothetical protein
MHSTAFLSSAFCERSRKVRVCACVRERGVSESFFKKKQKEDEDKGEEGRGWRER